MLTRKTPDWLESKKLGPVDLTCSWCSSDIPIPEGDLCGVCIECGMVMFREPIKRSVSDDLDSYPLEPTRESVAAHAVP